MDLYFKDLINRYTDNILKRGDNVYAVRVMGRGENLFFRENDRCLICEIDAEHGVIYKKSIKTWDSSREKMNKKERERVTALIDEFYKQVYNAAVVID